MSTGSPTLTGRVALVVGGVGGIGAAIAAAFCDHGARVVIADRSGAAAKERAEAVGAAGGVQIDVTSPGSVETAVRRSCLPTVASMCWLTPLASSPKHPWWRCPWNSGGRPSTLT